MPVVVLAGGLSRRMGGGDKSLCLLGGRPILAQILDRLGRQAGPFAINANGDPQRFADFGLPVLSDPVPDHPGPLAGLLAALIWAQSLGSAEVGTVSGDLPFLPLDLFDRLGPGPSHANSLGRDHPVVGRWPVTLAPQLRDWLVAGNRRVMDWTQAIGARAVPFAGSPDPFFNINTPDDLARASAFMLSFR